MKEERNMSGDPPGKDSNEDKEALVYVMVGGGWRCFRLGRCQVSCISNDHLWWLLVMFSIYVWMVYPPLLPHTPLPLGWQLACGVALRGGKDPGWWVSVPASPSWDFTVSGRDWDSLETMAEPESRHRASPVVRGSLRWFGLNLTLSQQPVWSHEGKGRC